MSESLTASLIASHRVTDRAGRPPRDGRLRVRADHVVCSERSGALALRLFDTLGLERVGCELALVACEDVSLARFTQAGEQARLERRARRRGVWLSRAGNGGGHRVYTARIGAPGRLALDAGDGLSSCGALGALSLPITAAEAAAALAGAAVELAWPGVLRVRLLGLPPVWLTGEDVALELERRFAFARPRGRVLEFTIVEAKALTFDDRITLSTRARGLGALAGLFPSDAETRGFLRAQGREADWKPLASPDEPEGPELELDFSDLEPLVASPGRGPVQALRGLGQARVGAVWVGPEATLADLERVAAVWAGEARPSEGVECLVTPGTRQLQETAARHGLVARLRAAGARVGSLTFLPRPNTGAGLALACGAPGARAAGWHEAGVTTCAAAALAGAVVDPRQHGSLELHDRADGFVLDDRLLVRPSPENTGTAEGEPRDPAVLPRASAITGPLRGTVLVRLGDHVGVDGILPWGARVRPDAQDIDRLARFAFAGIDGSIPDRARAQGEGWVVAGYGLGAGEPREEVALVALALGIRGMLAASFAPEFRRLLKLHGLLALRLGSEVDVASIAAGDELEIPDLPDGLEPGKPLVVRNLTQGWQVAAHHDLDEAGVGQIRAGGLLATVGSGD